jgi:hypothetical protein
MGRMKIQDVLAVRTVLRTELGVQWPIVLLRAVGKSRALFRRTDWADRGGAEAGFVRRLASMETPEQGGMARLMAFHDLMDDRGAPRFNTRIYKEKTASRCHFVITRCVFMDFFAAVNAPELTRFFCEVDRRFFPDAFPDIGFHRGDTWENTIAYGKPECEFVFEKKTAG